MQAWPAEHTVRAAVLRHLLIDQARPVDPKGIRLRGVRVVGVLDLQAATLRCPLVLDRCFLDTQEPICFDHAVALEISLVNCRLPGLTGELLAARSLNLNNSTISGPLLLRDADIAGYVSCRGVQLTGRDEYGDAFGADGIKATGIYLTDGFTASGTVRLPGAEIARVLACSGAQLNGRDEDGHALIADQMTVGTVLLDAGLTAAGAISVGGAHVTGDLNCTNASLNGCNKDGNALFATQISVGGSVLLDGNFAAAGTVRMVGADIGGSLICSGARLSGANDRGYSLLANESRVGGSVFLNEGFVTAGAVGLHGADIARALACDTAHLDGGDVEGNVALRIGGIQVGSVYLNDGFRAAGLIWLRHARVRGSVHLAPEKPEAGTTGLDAAHAQIAGAFEWLPTAQVEGPVNLQGATAGQLDDDWGSGRDNGFWPTGGQLDLDGFTYGQLGRIGEDSVAQRLAWIRSQFQTGPGHDAKPFATQPYEQLMTVYQNSGQDAKARKVAIARRSDLRKFGNLSRYHKAANFLLDKSIKYGYQTWRAVAWLAVLYLIFFGASYLAQHLGLMIPTASSGLHPIPVATRCTSSYPCFYPAGYAIDTVIPLINVHQGAYWGPNGSAPWGWAWTAGNWLATGLGWALATLAVAGYTGIVRRQ